MGNKISLEEELVNLKITSKQMQRAAKKCEKNEKAAVNKLKKVSRVVIPTCFSFFIYQEFSCSNAIKEELDRFNIIKLISFHFFTLGPTTSFNRQLHKGIQKVQEFMHKMQYEKKIR